MLHICVPHPTPTPESGEGLWISVPAPGSSHLLASPHHRVLVACLYARFPTPARQSSSGAVFPRASTQVQRVSGACAPGVWGWGASESQALTGVTVWGSPPGQAGLASTPHSPPL